jgi:hypothetical protein
MTSHDFCKSVLCAAIAATFSINASANPQALWTGAIDDQWTESANWQSSSPPQAGGDVFVTDTALSGNSFTDVTYTNPGDANPGSVASPLNWVTVDGSSASNMTLNQATDNLTTTTLTVGDLDTGNYSISGGTLNVPDVIDGGGVVTAVGSITLGNQTGSTGNFTQSGGDVTASALTVGNLGTGNYSITSGTLSVTNPDYTIATFVLGYQTGSVGTFTQDGGVVNLTGNSLVIGRDSGSVGTYDLNAGTLNSSGFMTLSFDGTGTFNQAAGTTATIRSDIYMDGNGSYNQNGGALTVNGSQGLIVSAGGSVFNQTAGSTQVTNGNVLVGGSGSGYVTQSGGSVTVDTGKTLIGSGNGRSDEPLNPGISGNPSGTGDYQQSGGTHTTNSLIIGQAGIYGAGTGTYTLSDNGDPTTSVLNTTTTVVGDGSDIYGGTGIFTQTGGTHTTTDLILASGTGSSGTYNLSGSGSVLQANNTIVVGQEDSGQFVQSDGSVTASTLLIGGNWNENPFGLGVGQYTLSGGTVTVGNTSVGETSQGTVLQTGGTFNAGYLSVGSSGLWSSPNPAFPSGYQPNSNGNYQLQGGILNTYGTVVGNFGIGSFTQNDNSAASQHNVNGNLVIGAGPAGVETNTGLARQGSYTLGGGTTTSTLTVSGNTIIGAGHNVIGWGPGGLGTFTQTGGTHTVTGDVIVGQLGTVADGTGTYNLSGGALAAANLRVNTGSTFNYSGGSLSLASGAGTWTNDGLANIQAAIPNGSLTVGGNVVNGGTFKVTDTNVTYTGTFTNNGSYISDPSTSHFTDLIITPTGSLQGGAGDKFIVGGTLDNNSTQTGAWDTRLATLEFSGNGLHTANFGNSSVFLWGNLLLDTGVQLNLTSDLFVSTLNLTDGLGQLLTILDTGNYKIHVGSFIAGGSNYAFADVISYLQANGGAALAGDLLQLQLPEPATILLFSSGLGLIMFASRRRKA